MQRRQFLEKNLALSAAALALPLAASTAVAQTESAPEVRHPSGRELRIGLVELDTSHADTIAQAVASLPGAEITAVINRGLVYGQERTDKFVNNFRVKKVCKTLEEMAAAVDIALVIGVDWDRHVDDAEPFIRAGVPVFVDKPVVGCEADARRLIELRTRYKTPIFGGSTYRYNPAFLQLKESLRALEDKRALTVYGKINSHSREDMLDLLYYGIHGTEAMEEVIGPGAISVQYMDFYRKEHLIHVHYDNRPLVVLILGWALKSTQAVLLTDSSVEKVEPAADEGAVYPLIFSHMAESIVSRREDRPISEQIEACRILVAAQKSRLTGQRVALSELEPEDGFDGDQFALEYRRFRNLPREAQSNWRENEL